jgi:ATPase subunit of ABC transporter with duplicated ATPase domains
MTVLLHTHDLTLSAPGGRALLRELTLILDRGDKVAIVGRNGVGKSTLLSVLAGELDADGGTVACYGERLLVPQGIDTAGISPGEARRRSLERAFEARPDLLLLDEPTLDLDQPGLNWLIASLRSWREGLIVVSHDRRVLRELRDFFVVAESGCRHFHGDADELLAELARAQAESESRYVAELERLHAREQRQFLVYQRRQRKKNVGRIRELDRATPRIRLNAKRGYAQVKQGKRAGIQRDRLEKAHAWAKAVRRSLAVQLPLSAAVPSLPDASPGPITSIHGVGAQALFHDLTLEVVRQRIAVVGPNGSGKSTLLALLAGTLQPERGSARSEPNRIGYVAQNAANWCLRESLLEHLTGELHCDPVAAASCIRAHGFPFALAARPLASLSPGERLRAALICLLQRPDPPELLILDEPTSHLDFLGQDALQQLLARWPGGLIVASHDQDFMHAIRLDTQLPLTAASHV